MPINTAISVIHDEFMCTRKISDDKTKEGKLIKDITKKPEKGTRVISMTRHKIDDTSLRFLNIAFS